MYPKNLPPQTTQVGAYNTYVGARYVPIFDGEWSKEKAYEPLTIVLREGNSYTSRQYVPLGIEITNNEYWALTGNFNGQLQYLTENVDMLTDLVNEMQDKILNIGYPFYPCENTIISQKSDVDVFNTNIFFSVIPSNYKPKIGTYDGPNSFANSVEASKKLGANIIANAGVWNVSTGAPIGVLIVDGKVVSDVPFSEPENMPHEILAIDSQGRLSFYPSKTTTSTELINNGVKYAVQGFFAVIKNGVSVWQENEQDWVSGKTYFGTLKNGNYFLMVLPESIKNMGLSNVSCIQKMIELGVETAYNLDGGRSSQLCYHGLPLSDVSNLGYRDVNNFIYFESLNPSSSFIDENFTIGTKMLEDNINAYGNFIFTDQVISLRNPGANYSAIEFYNNFALRKSNTRIGKLMAVTKNNMFPNCFQFRLNTNGSENIVLQIDGNGLSWMEKPLVAWEKEAPLLTDYKTQPSGMYFFENSLFPQLPSGNYYGWMQKLHGINTTILAVNSQLSNGKIYKININPAGTSYYINEFSGTQIYPAT